MTAYGRGEVVSEDRTVTVEIKAVNNRYRDVHLRMPASIQPLEEDIRQLISSRVRRGRLEVFIKVEKKSAEADYEPELNRSLARAYFRIFDELRENFGLDRPPSPEGVCQMKDMIVMRQKEDDLETLRPVVTEALSRALEPFYAMREREGRTLEADFEARLTQIEQDLDVIEKQAPKVVSAYQERLKERVAQLTSGLELEENRLLQEVALFASRCDITEEMVRARSHISQFRKTMAGDGAVGRRLDFLVQEINREVNTTSAKANDALISSRAVEIKGELEKIKEQVQNIE
jgi:uncharacterized protein (TIGR00255 family)